METLLGLSLMSIPVIILGLIFSFSILYSEKRILSKLAQKFDFEIAEQCLSKPGFSLTFNRYSQGRATRYSMDYEVHLEGVPSDFCLIPRGEVSALASKQGLPSQKCGDADFDGLFYHKRGKDLSDGQRGLLIDLWQILPGLSVSHRTISGKLEYEQSPQGFTKLYRVIERLLTLQQTFPTTETFVRAYPLGFMRHQLLAKESTLCWAAAVISGVLAFGYSNYLYMTTAAKDDSVWYGLTILACFLLLGTALAFSDCALKIKSGSYSAILALQWTRKWAIAASVAALLSLTPQADDPITAALVGTVGILALNTGLIKLRKAWEGILDDEKRG